MPEKRKNGRPKKTAGAKAKGLSLEAMDYTPDRRGCEKGRWIQHPEAAGASFLIASTSQNPHWEKALLELGRAIREDCAAAGVEPLTSDADEITFRRTSDAFAAHILLDWKGVTREGEPLEPTDENRKWFFFNVRWVSEWVIQEAAKRANYRAEALEQEAGN